MIEKKESNAVPLDDENVVLRRSDKREIANVSLSNLNEVGEKHFLNKTQITNCILEAPNGVATYSGDTVTVKAGLRVLVNSGEINSDGTIKNNEISFEEDQQLVVDTSGTVYVGADGILNLTSGCPIASFIFANGAVTSVESFRVVELLKKGDVSGTEWGSITGELANQTDLQSALDLKADKTELSSYALKTDLTKYNTAYITNAWVSGKSYYILFSNKFCMQGGFSAKSSGENINFFKKMANTNFNLQITAIGGYAASGWESLSTTGFVRSADNYDAFWRVEGYVA